MLNFGTTNNLPSPANDYFWKFLSGAAPDDIELKTGNGVTGIDAVNPQDSKLRLLLSQLFGATAGGIVYNSGNVYGVSGLGDDGGGTYVAQILFTDIITGELIFVQTNENFQINEAVSGATGTGDEYTRQVDKTGFITRVRDSILNDELHEERRFNSQEIKVIVAGVTVGRLYMDVTDNRIEKTTANGAMFFTQVEDGAGAGNDLLEALLLATSTNAAISLSGYKDYALIQYADDPLGANNRMQVKARIDRAAVEFNDVEKFAIKSDGKIQTNQTQAPALHAVKVADLPVYDSAGVLVGYIPVMT